MIKQLLKVNTLMLIVCLAASPVAAQVGINNPNPHSSAVLDIESTDKGMLIPRLTEPQRSLLSSPANGLIVMDTTLDMLYHYAAGSWYSVSPWVIGDVGTGLHSRFAYLTGILTQNPRSFLSVKGKMAVGSEAFVETSGSPDNSLVVQGRMGIGVTNPSVELEVAGDTRLNGDVYADAYQLNNTSGNSMIPSGSIIIWSGTLDAIPQGWVLCDGTRPDVPNLKNQFIIGAGNSYAPHASGGAINHQHSMDIPSMPSSISGEHTHTTGSAGEGCTSGSCTLDSGREGLNHGHNIQPDGEHNHILNVAPFNSGYGDTDGVTTNIDQPLIPYFALAYIMKL